MCNDYFDLDFDTPKEIKNEEVKEGLIKKRYMFLVEFFIIL